MASLDVMVDLETLSLRPDASILSIGAAVLLPDGDVGGTFLANIDPRHSGDAYHIDPDTVLWWMAQNHAAREEALRDAEHISVALLNFTKWLDHVCVGRDLRIWASPSYVDIPILAHAFRAQGLPVPWHHRAVFDLRTFALSVDPSGDIQPSGEKTHTALGDAVWQATYLGLLCGRRGK